MTNNFCRYSPYNQVVPYNQARRAPDQCTCFGKPRGCFPPGPPGPPCPPGPPGPPGAAASTIPFSIGQYGASFYTDGQGNPLAVNFAGFSSEHVSPLMLQPGEWATGIIALTESTPYPPSFIMPRTATLRSIYVVFSTFVGGANFDPGVIVTPFASLAIAGPGDNLVYNILPDTITNTQPYTGGVFYPKHTLRRGSTTGLNIPIAEGSQLGIVLGIRAQNITEEQFANLSASGGLYFE